MKDVIKVAGYAAAFVVIAAAGVASRGLTAWIAWRIFAVEVFGASDLTAGQAAGMATALVAVTIHRNKAEQDRTSGMTMRDALVEAAKGAAVVAMAQTMALIFAWALLKAL